MGLQNETKVLFLIPNVDTTVCTTRVADTIFIKRGTVELGLCVFLSESTILE
jgi:peroxiredoxin